jgi:TaqI-like C-terminal specificity domain/Eco57I restriction-modification methylase
MDIKPTLKKIFPKTYNGRSDLYCYFYARSLQLLKPGGMLAFISSNKWFQSGYGAKLREHISENCQVCSITDFGELPVFKNAATFPMIFIAQNSKVEFHSTTFTQVKTLDSPYPNISDIIASQGLLLPQTAINGASWTLANSNSAQRIQQMKSIGTPLKNYVDVQIYSGIKTGNNSVFWIGGEMKDRLISADKNSSEVIKRLVRGEDIRKWQLQTNDLYIIYTHSSIDIDRYPAIKNYLMQFKKDLENRAGSQKWWQLQQAQYRENIWENPKIVYPYICKESRFTFDEEGAYANMNGFILPTSDLYLLAILNSRLAWWYLKQVCVPLGDSQSNGRLLLKKQHIDLLPIPQASEIERKAISKLVQKCLDAKGVGCEAWEREIDEIVAGLYGFASETLPLDAKSLGFGKGMQHEQKVPVLAGKTITSEQSANTRASIESDLN